MTCPKCNGALAYLFTSSYCPACERREDEKPATAAVYGPVRADGSLFVGDDGELWVQMKGTAVRITQDSMHGPIVAFSVMDNFQGYGRTLSVMRHADGYSSQILHFGVGHLLRDATPRFWWKP